MKKLIVAVTGKRALFARPEMRGERVSYDILTPSSAEGILKAIYWKPEMEYVITRIHSIQKPKKLTVFVNDQEGKATYKDIEKDRRVFRAASTTGPRSMQILTDVHFVIEADIRLTGIGTSADDSEQKHYEIFRRRAEKGQCFRQPCLGAKEFDCQVTVLEESEVPCSVYKGRQELGLMLHHMDFESVPPKPVFFEAVMEDGIMDTELSEENLPGTCQHGWVFRELVNHYEAKQAEYDLAQPGFSREKIHYEAVLTADGSLKEFHPLRLSEKGKVLPEMMLVPELVMGRTSGIKPNFLWDNEKYVFGIDKTAEDGEKKRKAFREKIRDVLSNPTTDVLALLAFLSAPLDITLIQPYLTEKNGISKLDGNVVFRIEGKGFFHEDPEICRQWMEYYQEHKEGKKGICIVTGKEDVLASMHPLIKGVVGASSFAKLISLDCTKQSFECYGMKGLENSPLGCYATFAYSTMLNYLLSKEEHRVSIGKVTFVFWSETDSPQLLTKIKYLLTGYQDEGVDYDAEVCDNERFYVLGLQGNSSRLVIRYYESFLYGSCGAEIQDFCVTIKNEYKGTKLKQNWDYIANWKEEDVMNEDTKAYQLGMLFAILEKAQKDAVPSTKSTISIADKYISIASKTPARIFPKLMGNSVHHLNKKDYGMGKQIAAITKTLEAMGEPFPKLLTQQEQGVFFIGYYQKKDSFFQKKEGV